MKIVFLLNKRNPTNTNVQKLKKAHRELKHSKKNKKNTCLARSMKAKISSIYNHDRQKMKLPGGKAL